MIAIVAFLCTAAGVVALAALLVRAFGEYDLTDDPRRSEPQDDVKE